MHTLILMIATLFLEQIDTFYVFDYHKPDLTKHGFVEQGYWEYPALDADAIKLVLDSVIQGNELTGHVWSNAARKQSKPNGIPAIMTAQEIMEYNNTPYNWWAQSILRTTWLDSLYYSTFYESSFYDGRAHEAPYSCWMTFDLRTGKRLKPEDVLTDPEAVYEWIRVTHNVNNVLMPNIKTECCVGMDAEGVVLHYPTYAIDCYAAGPQNIRVPNKWLKIKRK